MNFGIFYTCCLWNDMVPAKKGLEFLFRQLHFAETVHIPEHECIKKWFANAWFYSDELDWNTWNRCGLIGFIHWVCELITPWSHFGVRGRYLYYTLGARRCPIFHCQAGLGVASPWTRECSCVPRLPAYLWGPTSSTIHCRQLGWRMGLLGAACSSLCI